MGNGTNRLRSGAFVLVAVTVFAVVLASSASGRTLSAGPADRFEAIGSGEITAASYAPLGLQDGPVTVMVQLSGNTVGEVQDQTPDRKLTREEKRRIAAGLKAREDAIKPAIQSLGGQVLSDFQYAYNGVKVRIARSKTADLAKLPNVLGVHNLTKIKPDNIHGVPMIGAPQVWNGNPDYRGNLIRIGIIDTGIDYTHANFGGPGTPEAFQEAAAHSTEPADPTLFGPNAKTKIKGGVDLVGDDYDAGSPDPGRHVPHPDPNPLDCAGHGSHVAGTAAGYGVTSDGKTYTGPWKENTISTHSWNVGPGVAPKADLYAIRVFGCEGSTDVTVDAIEWAVENELNVINMSLGSPFGTKDDPSAVAATNAAKAGLIVVASAGNSGGSQYITGAPAAGVGAISVAANDPIQETPGATLALSTGQTITAINANGYPFSATTWNVKRIVDNPATPTVDESLGCNVSDFGALPANTLAVVYRGVCARVAKAINGQKAGATAVAMVNNSAGLPPFEGKITSNPDNGEPYEVTIPFLGVRGGSPVPPTSDGGKLYAADGGTANASPTTIPNANFTGFADFSSGGPRNGDSGLKPDVTAPGVSIMSTAIGTGSEGTIMSGTSMAAPHVSGLAALVKQSHLNWSSEDLKAAIVNTGNPAGVGGVLSYRTSRGGTGLVSAPAATKTQVAAIGDKRTGSLSYGFEELSTNYSKTKQITLRNHAGSAITFDVSQTNVAGSPHTVAFSGSSVTVPANGSATLDVTLNVPVATVGGSDAFREVVGLVSFSPQSGQNNGVTLRVPYYLVPRASSKLTASVADHTLSGDSPSTTANLKNAGPVSGDADFYAWGISDQKDAGGQANDVRGAGLQSFPFPSQTDPTRQLLVAAVNTYTRWSNAATNEFDLLVDVNGDGSDDYVVVGVDLGLIQAGVFNGVMASAVFSTRSSGASIAFLASAPTDSSTVLLPFLSSQLCRVGEPCLSKDTNPRLSYHLATFDIFGSGAVDETETAKYNAWSSSISQGDFQTLAPGQTGTSPVTIDRNEWALTPARGIMVVTVDDKSGGEEADLESVSLR